MRRLMLVLTLLSILFLALPALAESIVDAPPSCRVWVNGEEVTVYETAVNHQRVWTSRPQLSTSPVAVAPAEGSVEMTVEFLNSSVTSAAVHPLSLGVDTTVTDGRITFTLPAPTQCVVEVNNQAKGALHLFLHAPEKEPTGNSVRYFGPGVHEERVIYPENGETIYLAEGCILRGSIFAEGKKDITIAGPGIISGSTFDRFADTLVPIDLRDCNHVTIRGITILDPSAWTLNLYKCNQVTVESVNIIGARSNSDGITIQSCRDVAVRDCFVRSWDDSLVVKGYDGDVHNITFDNMILWTDLAQSCEIGYETRANVIEDIAFRNITVLHNFHKPVLSIHNSDNAAVSHVLFEDIVIEDGQMGEGDGQPFLIDLSTTKSQWSQSAQRGTIRDVTIRRVNLLSGKTPSIRIFSFNKTYNIDDVLIEDLTILGEKITSLDQLKCNTSPRNGKNIAVQVTAP